MHITVNEYNINYKFTGTADVTVVILQGWGTNCELYDIIANTLCSKYRVLQFDLPGFGNSDEPLEPWSVDDYPDCFLKLMENLDIKKATLIGHSYGGRVIIKLTGRDNIPFQIDKIVLIDSAGVLPPRTLKKRFRVAKYKLIKKIVNINLVYKMCPDLIDAWRNRQGSEDYKNASPIMRQRLVKAVNEDLTHLFAGNTHDTLLIWGDLDTATPLSDAKKMEELMPNAGLAVINNAGHFCFVEKQGIFTSIIKSYFEI